jgi:pimeloyl-ACP methyl ester carboxylesterase
VSVLLGIVGAIVVALIAAVIAFRARPVEFIIYLGRAILRMAGLARKVLITPSGSLVYFVGGKGPPLVLVHGVNDQAGSWAKVALKLRRNFRLIIPDLAGHGQSAPADGPLPLELLVDSLDAVIRRETGDEPIALAGNSLGGWLVTLYTLRYPEKVRTLILETGGALEFDSSELNLAPSTREEADRILKQVWGPDMGPFPGYMLDGMIRRSPRAPVHRVNAAKPDPLTQFVPEDRMRGIRVPTTLIWGEFDGILPLEYAERLTSLIPGAKLHVIKRCGHCPHREKPNEFVALLTQALGGASASGRPSSEHGGASAANRPSSNPGGASAASRPPGSPASP